MHFALISKILGLLLVVFSFTMMPPVAVSYWYQEGSEGPFLVSFVITLLLGLALWLPFFKHKEELQTRDGFLVAFLNPKVALFFLALFSQFLQTDMAQAARIQMVLTSMFIDGGWYVLVALLLGRSRFLPWLRAHHHWVEKGTAVLLVVIAASVVWQVA